MEVLDEAPVTAPGPVPGGLPVAFQNINQGTVAIEASRAIAEAQSKLYIAKTFPRDEAEAVNKMKRACSRQSLAEKAFYSFPRAGQNITGPTIRFAEELARCWGNIDYGIKELSQDEGKSEMQAYAWDLETNTQSVQNFTNPHKREKSDKRTRQVVMEDLVSQRDIYENNANMATRRLRARILAVIPAWFVDEAIQACQATLRGDGKASFDERKSNLITEFDRLGVDASMLKKYLKHDAMTMDTDEFLDLVGVFNSIKTGERKAAEWFNADNTPAATAALTDALKGGRSNP
jgi:hypothetical protein